MNSIAGSSRLIAVAGRGSVAGRRAIHTASRAARSQRASTGSIAAGAAVGGLLATYTYYRSVRLDDSRTGRDVKDVLFALQTNDAPSPNAGDQVTQYITMKEVARHNLAQDAWVVVDGKVYDVTDFHKNHPGGSAIIVGNAGRDVTNMFKPVHPPDTLERNLAPENLIGTIDPEEAKAAREAYETEQEQLRKAREGLPEVETMLGLDELQKAAESCMSDRAENYYGGYSLDGYSMHENRSAFRKCRLVPRVMRNVLEVRPQTTLFGITSPLPIYVSPSSNALLGHPDGELNITRGAARTGIIQGVSAAASFSLTDILDEKAKMDEEGDRPMGMVYQVYFQKDRSKTEAQVREAVAGGVQALMLTVDSAIGDHRQVTEKLKGTKGEAEPGIKMGVHTETPTFHDAKLCWDDLPWLRSLAGDLPIYLKGVSHIDDVRLAKEHGIAGCILSNHGGRQLDQARTGFDSLRAIHAADPTLSKQIELYIDGGVRRGTDVLQAIALGAKGVGLGRPFLWAQAAYGEKGVIRAVRILENEITTAMRLLGVTSLNQVDSRMVECLQEIWK